MPAAAAAPRRPLLSALIARARRVRAINLAVVNLRFLIGFAFLPAAVKKLLDQPFTDPAKGGPFHDFLDAFHATGGFYRVVGTLQLAAAVLLLTQRFATVGALVALPILTAIAALCWSTAVYPTAAVVTLMWLGTASLLLWDVDKWRAVLARDDRAHVVDVTPIGAVIDLAVWARGGAAILALYLGSALAHGGVYRPRGVELDQPGFYVLPLVTLVPVLTWLVERRRIRRGQGAVASQ